MTDVDFVEERLLKLIHLEEERFIAGFHQNVENKCRRHGMIDTLRKTNFHSEVLFLCTTIKKFKHPGKLKTHWLGPYVVKEITNGGPVKLEKLDGMEVRWLINGSLLKPYFDNRDPKKK